MSDWTTPVSPHGASLHHQGLCVRCALRAQITVATWLYRGLSLCGGCLAHQRTQDAAAGRPPEPDVQPLDPGFRQGRPERAPGSTLDRVQSVPRARPWIESRAGSGGRLRGQALETREGEA